MIESRKHPPSDLIAGLYTKRLAGGAVGGGIPIRRSSVEIISSFSSFCTSAGSLWLKIWLFVLPCICKLTCFTKSLVPTQPWALFTISFFSFTVCRSCQFSSVYSNILANPFMQCKLLCMRLSLCSFSCEFDVLYNLNSLYSVHRTVANIRLNFFNIHVVIYRVFLSYLMHVNFIK